MLWAAGRKCLPLQRVSVHLHTHAVLPSAVMFMRCKHSFDSWCHRSRSYLIRSVAFGNHVRRSCSLRSW